MSSLMGFLSDDDYDDDFYDESFFKTTLTKRIDKDLS